MVKELWRTLWRTQTATNAGRIWRLFFSLIICPRRWVWHLVTGSARRLPSITSTWKATWGSASAAGKTECGTSPCLCTARGTAQKSCTRSRNLWTVRASGAERFHRRNLHSSAVARQHQLVALTQAHDGHTLYNDYVFLTLLELDNLRVGTNCVWFP